MDEVKTRLVFRRPGRQDRGFLRRNIEIGEILKALRADPNNPDLLKRYAWHLSRFVIDPPDRKAAYEALLDASQEELDELGQMTRGEGTERPLSARESETPSD